MGGQPAATKEKEHTSIRKDELLEENIKREVKFYRLCENFTLTPTMQSNLILSQKPTGERYMKNGNVVDDEYIKLVKKMNSSPREKYPEPLTSSQEYGWDIETLVPTRGTQFSHPRLQSDITKFYSKVMSEKKEKQSK